MAHRSLLEIPDGLRARLEVARLDLLALFRALDGMNLSPEEIPQRLLRQLLEWDADLAEALWALDQPAGSLDRRAMLRIYSPSWTVYRQRAPSFGKSYRPVPIPFWFNWKAASARHSTPKRPTTWCQAEIPKTFKHPERGIPRKAWQQKENEKIADAVTAPAHFRLE